MIFHTGTDDPVDMRNMLFRSVTPVQFTWDIEGRDGYFLRADTVAELTVEAREQGDVPWTNIETTPIDTAPYIGVRQPFEFRITPGAITERDRVLFEIYCSR